MLLPKVWLCIKVHGLGFDHHTGSRSQDDFLCKIQFINPNAAQTLLGMSRCSVP